MSPAVSSLSSAKYDAPQAVAASRPVSPLVGILVLILSTWALSGLDASGKWIMATGVPVFVMGWIRYLVHLVLVFSLIVPTRGKAVIRSVKPSAQIVRGLLMLFTTLMFFTTLQYLPQAEATAINFLAPLIMLSLAPWVLGEAPRRSRWLAALIGFLGVLIIIRPSAGLHPVGTLLGLMTACVFAAQYIATRRVAADDSFTTLIWSGLIGGIGLSLMMPFVLPAALPVLSSLSLFQWLILLSTGLWGALGHLLQIQAYRLAPASMLAPFVYLQIISAAGLGWLVWGDFPDALTWLGITIVCCSGAGIAWYEWQSRRRMG